MPIYSYRCTDPKCLNEFEELRKIHEDVSTCSCPDCGSEAKKQLVTGSFKFKYGSPTGSRQGV